MKNPLNLLDHCRRALGEWQGLDGNTSRLHDAKEKVPLGNFPGAVSIEQTPPEHVGVYENQFTAEQEEYLKSLEITTILTYELYTCDPPHPGSNSMSNIDEIQNWISFSDTKITLERSWLVKLRMMQPSLKDVSLKKKESWYWAMKLRHKGFKIVPAVLISAKKWKNIDCWELPDGTKVELSNVRELALEVAPTNHYLIGRSQFEQIGGTVCDDLVIPNVMQCPGDPYTSVLKLMYRRVDPEEGLTKTHYVLEAKLPNGKSYIVDPTSMQFNYRGPNKSLIAHGEWDDYVKNFPGKVLQRLDTPLYPTGIEFGTSELVPLNTIYDEMFWLGNGPQKHIDKLVKNMTTYRERRCCGYCGWIEGEHKIKPKEQFRYKFKATILLNCIQCKKVAYCGTLCQKEDWKSHKIICKKTN